MQVEQRGSSEDARRIGCLHESYLLSLGKPKVAIPWPAIPKPRNWRWLFCKQVASILRWTVRRSKGYTDGYSEEISKLLRDIFWPNAKPAHQHDVEAPSSSTAQGGGGENGEAKGCGGPQAGEEEMASTHEAVGVRIDLLWHFNMFWKH